jgi:hypothetical protein
MGLLDDAIREHLELKRSHGGDPSEIERQEREAFGPAARRQAADEAEAARAGGSGPADEAPAEPEGREAAPEAPLAPPAPAEPPPPAPPAEPEDAMDAPFDAERDAPGGEEDPWLVEETAEEKPEAEPEEDVLEETPDFLQETPEHDRLWFEQKPPRDFDWDK